MFKKLFALLSMNLLLITSFSSLCYADEIDYSEDFIYPKDKSVVAAPSAEPNINSRSAIILERSTGTILYEKNSYSKVKMASTTKIMTAIIVLEHSKDLSECVTVSKKAASIGGSRLGLSTNCTISVNDLLYGLMLCSGNDAAIALAEFIGGSLEGFSSLMNEKALELGLLNTHFITPHGLDSEEHYTTAYELAILTNYALKNEIFRKIVSTLSYNVMINDSPKSVHNTNELLGYLPGIYGVKTGFTNGANRCLVTACKRENMDIICVVLGADTKKFRTQDSIKLIEYAFSNFKMVDITNIINGEFKKWQISSAPKFTVNKGINNSVSTKLEELKTPFFPINKDNLENINVTISCDYIFNAPLFKNKVIGNIACNVGSTSICKLNIITNSSIAKKNILLYIQDFFSKYFLYLESIFV